MVGPAACMHAPPEDWKWRLEDWVVAWFHRHDVVAPDICALLLASAVADMRLASKSPRDLLRLASFFLALGFGSDLCNFVLSQILANVGGSATYELWMINHLHGPGKFVPNSHEC